MVWSKENDDLIIGLYKTLTVSEIAKKTGFTASAISQRLHKLGIKDSKKFTWDDETLNKMLTLIDTHSIPEIAKKMNIPKMTVASKLGKLGLKAVDKRPKPWTEEEIEFLKANYNAMNKEYLAEKLGRTYQTVVARAALLGISEKGRPQKLWSKEEEEYLRRYYNVKPRRIIAKNLGRTEESIHLKAKKMKLGNKSEKRITTTVIANILGLTKDTVNNLYSKGILNLRRVPDSNMLHITLPELIKFMEKNQYLWDSRLASYELVFNRKPAWLIAKEESDKLTPLPIKNIPKAVTMTEINIIKELHSKGLSISEIAKKINRSENTVRRYALENATNEHKTGYYTDEEINFIQENLNSLSVNEIANKLNRSIDSIKAKIKRIEENENVEKIRKMPWTEKELDNLQKNLEKSIPELQKIIKTRSYRAIDHKKRELLGLE